MGRQNGVYQDAKGRWRVDKLHRGERLQGRFGSHQEAEAWLIAKCAEIDAYGPVSARSMTLAEAATRYLLEEERAGKPSLSTESYLLEPVIECVGHLQLDQIHDGTLRPFVDRRLAEGRSHKTVNLSLGVVRHMLNRACRNWRVDVGGGRTVPVLLQVSLLTMLALNGHQRDPQPIVGRAAQVASGSPGTLGPHVAVHAEHGRTGQRGRQPSLDLGDPGRAG